jgi:hypothetical protein
MTNRRWRALKASLILLVAVAVVVALSSFPLSQLPSSTYLPAPSGQTASSSKLTQGLQQTHSMAPTVAVIGSGLAGLSAAYELSQALQAELPQAKIVILEKNNILGGNSAKASSGINAVHAAAGDSMQAYAADTTKSGGGFSTQQLVETLAVSEGCRACLGWQLHGYVAAVGWTAVRQVIQAVACQQQHCCLPCLGRQ